MLHVSLLGEQAITDDRAGSIRGRSSRVVALVAFLVLHAGSAQARPRIAGLLWPESTDAQALTNLRRELHHLRQILGDEPTLVVTPRELCWSDTKTCHVDVRVFDTEREAALAAAAADDDDGILRHAPAAIAAYRGELLPACTTTGSSTPGRSLSASAWTCATWPVRHGREWVTWPERWRRPGAGSSCSRWRKSAITL
ncbi:MAG: hypothetical protein ABR922_08645 [Streptosporangiaceae bacterium]